MNPTNVCCVSIDFVRPATQTSGGGRIDLTPWDLVVLQLHYIQRGLLFLKPQEEESTLINHLKTSFSRTIDYFAPLTGRLATQTHEEDNTVSFYIDCNIVGALFIHSKANITVADILDPLYIPNLVHSFFPLNGVANYEGKSQPLLAVQVTELVDSIFIGCSMNHLIADGKSFWYFINSWSAISRNLNHIPVQLPIFKRWFLNESDCPIRFPSSIQDKFVENAYTPPVLYHRMFHFTPEKLAQIKLKANAEEHNKKYEISCLQALMGHIWITVTRARCLDPNQEVTYAIVVGNRARLNPPLPEEYFANSGKMLIATARAGELLEKGAGLAALLLNQVITSFNGADIHRYWESWMKKPVVVSPGKRGHNRLVTGSSPRFDMYGNDFGWGSPIAMRSGNAYKIDGTIAVHPGSVQGSLDVEVSLPPQVLKTIEDYTEFTDLHA